MTDRASMKTILLAAMIATSLAGYMVHARIHLAAQNFSFAVPLGAGLLSILAVPLLFAFPRTVSYGYVLNGFLCIVGTVTMGHFAIAHWSAPDAPPDILFRSMVLDILILWGRFFAGKALFDLETFGYDPDRVRQGMTWRYPNLGWWLVHLAGVSLVYTLGHWVWR